MNSIETGASNELVNINSYVPNVADIGHRVLCLYRVSTDGQVTYDDNNDADIPMQRRECRRFLEKQNWVLVHEEREDGVSGHKIRAEKRDSIQYIKELVAARKVDIFLVFMFDRIGRIADETPFVVEWLVKNGVRVWSTQEGEQRFDNHTDKLMNYIRFWQADGESEKTSIRTKASLGQLVEDGHYKGGNAPYGYCLVKSGRLDKKKNEKNNLAINEEEAVLVRRIFDLYVSNGYGVHRIANLLINEGVKTRAGKNWHHCSIRGIIRNLTYTGVLRSGDSRSQVIDEIQIISPSVYQKAQDIMNKRRIEGEEKRTYPMNTESRCLLNGKLYCASCGYRLHVATGEFIIAELKQGLKQRSLRYMCYGKSRKRTNCTGQNSYLAKKVDYIVDNVVRKVFNQMQRIPKSEVVDSSLSALQHEMDIIYKAVQRDCIKAESDVNELKSEVIKAIRGESKFASGLLSNLITEAESRLAESAIVLDNAKQELDNCNYRISEMQEKYDEVISWTELYDSVEWSAKKMIIANLINRIDVGKDYNIHIDFNIDLTPYNIDQSQIVVDPDGYTYEQSKTA